MLSFCFNPCDFSVLFATSIFCVHVFPCIFMPTAEFIWVLFINVWRRVVTHWLDSHENASLETHSTIRPSHLWTDHCDAEWIEIEMSKSIESWMQPGQVSRASWLSGTKRHMPDKNDKISPKTRKILLLDSAFLAFLLLIVSNNFAWAHFLLRCSSLFHSFARAAKTFPSAAFIYSDFQSAKWK